MPMTIYQALADIKRLRRDVLESRQFYGYSGVARIIGGVLALLTAILLSSPLVTRTERAHLEVWGALCVISLTLNYVALGTWYLRIAGIERSRVKPIFDPVPALLLGGFLSIACILRGYHDLLFGIWMSCFGVAHIAGRDALDREVSYLGWYYLLAGFIQLFILKAAFLDPWPMGLVFFIGELTGGLIFLRMRKQTLDGKHF